MNRIRESFNFDFSKKEDQDKIMKNPKAVELLVPYEIDDAIKINEKIKEENISSEEAIEEIEREEYLERRRKREQELAEAHIRDIKVAVKELRNPIVNLLDQLSHEINNGEYGVIVGEDASGRIPTLIFDKIIKNIDRHNSFPPPKTIFFAGSSIYSSSIEDGVKINNIARLTADALQSQSMDGKKRKALIVTEYVEEGQSIETLITAMQQGGIDFDVAVLRSRTNVIIEELRKKYHHEIHCGEFREMPPYIFNKSYSGVIKESGDTFSKSVREGFKKRNRPCALRSVQEDVNLVRKYAADLADDLTKWYENVYIKKKN